MTRSQLCKILGEEHSRKREQLMQMPWSGKKFSMFEGESDSH